MNSLPYCPQPLGLTHELVLRSARWLLIHRAIPVPDMEAAANDLADVYQFGMDGYALGRALETEKGWDWITTSVVTDLDALEPVALQELRFARLHSAAQHSTPPA